MPSDMAYRKAFGSWGNALIYCGYNVAKPFPSEKCRVAAGNAKRGKKGENAANWKGGKFKSKFGYILIWDSEYKRYVPEHRKIMEEYLGRKLLSNEDVHHINRIKDDNRIENLQVISHSEHTLLHEKEDKVKHICKSGKKCLFPDCEIITNSKYGLCAKHYRRQWNRLKNGTISDMHDFSQSKRKHSNETKEKLREYAIKQRRINGKFASNIHDNPELLNGEREKI